MTACKRNKPYLDLLFPIHLTLSDEILISNFYSVYLNAVFFCFFLINDVKWIFYLPLNMRSSRIMPAISPAPDGPSIASSLLSIFSLAQIRQHPQTSHPESPSPHPHSLKFEREVTINFYGG